MTIGNEQFLEIIDLQLQILAKVDVANVDAVVLEVFELYVRVYIDTFDNGFLARLKVLMLDELETMTVVNAALLYHL